MTRPSFIVAMSAFAIVCASPHDAHARRPGTYDPGVQKRAAVGGAALGLLGGALLGIPAASIGFVACHPDDSAGVSEAGLVCGLSAMGVLALGGAMAGASWATWETGGRSPGDATAGGMWLGAGVGALVGGATSAAVIAGLARSGGDVFGAALLITPVVVSLTTGLGAAFGYEAVYPHTYEKFTLVPTLGPDRAGVALGFTF
jgi:hypothetical protein